MSNLIFGFIIGMATRYIIWEITGIIKYYKEK